MAQRETTQSRRDHTPEIGTIYGNVAPSAMFPHKQPSLMGTDDNAAKDEKQVLNVVLRIRRCRG